MLSFRRFTTNHFFLFFIFVSGTVYSYTKYDYPLYPGNDTTKAVGDSVIFIEGKTIPVDKHVNVNNIDVNVRTISSEQISTFPERDLRRIVASYPGVVQDARGGPLYIRGGRSNEVGYAVDGSWANDPLTGSLGSELSRNSIEKIIFTPGGYSAEFGNAMSGIVGVTTKSGKQNYFGSVEFVTDEFLGDGFKGLRSNGSSLWSLSFGGPVIPANSQLLQFFGTFEYQFDRDPNPSYFSERLRDIANSIWPKFQEVTVNLSRMLRNLPLYDPNSTDAMAALKEEAKSLLLDQPSWNSVRPGQMPNGSQRKLLWNEKINLNLGDLKFILSGISSRTQGFDRSFQYSLMDAFHNPYTFTTNDLYTFKTTWAPQPKTFMEAQVNYFLTYSETMDPVHEDRLFDYGDPYKNPLFTKYSPLPPEQLYGLRIPMDPYIAYFALPGRVYNYYGKNKTTFWQFKANVIQQIENHEIKFGGEYKIHSLRQYSIAPLSLAIIPDSIKEIIKQNPDLLTDAQRTYVSRQYQTRGVNTYGYDIFGREIKNTGYNFLTSKEGPKQPIQGALYLQDKFETEGFIVNAGLRWDYWNTNTEFFKDIYDITNSKNTQMWGTPDNFILHNPGEPVPTDGWGNSNFITPYCIEKVKTISHLSPRLSLLIPASERTSLFAQCGIFYQMPPLNDMLSSLPYLGEWYKQPGYLLLNNPQLHPAKTVQYEIGLRQQVNSYLDLNATVYYKHVTELIRLGFIQSNFNKTTFSILQNGDEANIKGLEIQMELKRWNNFSGMLNYTLSSANGTGSNEYSLGTLIWLNATLPVENYPLNFDQRHTISATIDYRFGDIENAIFNKLGFNLLFRANSGRPYVFHDPNIFPTDSRILSSVSNDRYSDWNFRFDLRIDKTFELPLGVNLNAYLMCLNLFNSVEIVSVESGYTTSDEFKQVINRLIEQGRASEVPVYTGLSKMSESQPGNVGAPRQMRLGVMVEF
jgi:hypothetical protein